MIAERIVPYRIAFSLLLVLALHTGCSPSQPVKNVWKGTKNAWYSYVNVPAVINYDDTGKMSEYDTRFSKAMMGIDVQLLALERAMQNADKPPTPEWLNVFFTQFPWVDGIIGLNGDGNLVGRAGRMTKQLDYGPLFERDPKQHLHALKGHAQNADGEPTVLLAVPLHDGPDFLGLVVAFFEMRTLMRYSDAPDYLVTTSPDGPLWSGASAGTLPYADWKAILRRGTSGTIADASGTYQWVSRFLGNYPLVFAMQTTTFDKIPGKTATPVTPYETTSPLGDPFFPADFDTAPFFDEDDFPPPDLPPLPNL
jgi:hypothetical protein